MWTDFTESLAMIYCNYCTISVMLLGFVGGVRGTLEGSMGADGRLPLFAVEGELLGEEEEREGDGGRGLCWWELGVGGGLSCIIM